jgi:iron complex outermembrane receptor protein
MLKTRLGLLGCASLFALSVGAGVAAPARAQVTPTPAAPSGSAPASGVTTIADIIVTARRTAESVQKVPIAVTAYSGAKIGQLVVNDVQDLNKLTPGLQTQACSGTRNCDEPSIRGQGTSFGTSQSSVISYYAEVPNFYNSTSGPSVLDLASLQVVKGPQGTLFGATATGGVLLYEPRKPSQNDLNGYVTAQVGNYNYTDIEGAVGGAIIPDVLQWRIAGKDRERDGYTTAIQSWGGHTDVDNVDQKEGRLEINFKPLKNLEDFFIYSVSYNSSHGSSSPLGYVDNAFMNPGAAGLVPSEALLFGIYPSPFPAEYQFQTGAMPTAGLSFAQLQTAELAKQMVAGPRTTFYDYSHQNAQQFQGIVNQTKWDIFDNLTLKNIFGLHWERDRGPSIDVDGGDLPLVDTRAPVVPGTTNLYNPKYAWVDAPQGHEISDEIQLQGKLFNNRLVWQVGGYYSEQTTPDWTPNSLIWVFESDANTPDPFNGASCVPLSTNPAQQCLSQLQKTWEQDTAVYTQETFAILDNLHVTAGVRHSWSDTSTTTGYADTDFVVSGGVPMALPVAGRSPNPGTVTTQTVPAEQRNTYTLALDWQATKDLLLYVTNRTGYKPGGINGNAPAGNPDREFGPEDLTDVEVGAKSDWSFMGMRGRTNIAIFHDDYNSIQTSSIIPGTATTITLNAARAVIQGVELEGSLYVNDWLEINGWYGYLDAHYTQFNQSYPCSGSSEYWYSECFNPAAGGAMTPGLTAGATSREVLVNNASGAVTFIDGNFVNGAFAPVKTVATFRGSPTPLNQTAKNTFSLQPTLHLKPWLHQDISVTANIQYTEGEGNKNPYPGLTLPPSPTGSVQPLSTYNPSRVITDLHVDWKNPFGSRATVSAVVTNLTNELYNISNQTAFTIGGGSEYIYSEPRMMYVQVTVPFGGR